MGKSRPVWDYPQNTSERFSIFFYTPFPMSAVFFEYIGNKIELNFNFYPLQIANVSYGQPYL